MKKTFFFLMLCTLPFSLVAQSSETLPDSIFTQKIKTVQFTRKGVNFSYPIVDLNDTTHLFLSFDELASEPENFDYSIIHCDANWKPSRLSTQEYQQGFDENPVNNYESSISTNIPYVHYTLTFPNEDVSWKLSGNYIVEIYPDGDKEHPVLMKRFEVAEHRVNIKAEIKRPILPQYQDKFQQIQFTINYASYPVDDPSGFKVSILKNNHWSSALQNLQPDFINNQTLVYNNDATLLFQGGNEYRGFDLKSLKYQAADIQSIDFTNNAYQVILKPDQSRIRSYFYNQDLDGGFLIGNQQGDTPATDAEYVHVHLSLIAYQPVDHGNVYVCGGFSNFQCLKENQMSYDEQQQLYRVDLLVKQGYYDYQYIYVPNTTHKIDAGYFEGNYYETENNYTLLVYYRPYGDRYDHLVGYLLLNSLKKDVNP